jgi:hypothetical protein
VGSRKPFVEWLKTLGAKRFRYSKSIVPSDSSWRQRSILVFAVIDPAIVTRPHGLDGSASAQHDDRVVAFDENPMSAQPRDQLLVTPAPARAYRPCDRQSRSAPDMIVPKLPG